MGWIRGVAPSSSTKRRDLVAECAATGCSRTEAILEPSDSPIDHLDIAQNGWEVGSAGEGRWQFICPRCAKKRRVVLMSWRERGPPFTRVRCANAAGELPLRSGRLRLHPLGPVRDFHLPRGWVAIEEEAEGVTEIRFFCPSCWTATLREARDPEAR